jgi:hypothetical protein
MINLQTYDEFTNEELNWKDIKRFGKGIKIEYKFAKSLAILKLLKFLFSWNKEMRGTMRDLQIFTKRTRNLKKIVNIHDMTLKNVDKMPEDELVAMVNHMAEEYENKYGASFVEDLKIFAEAALKNSMKKEKNQKSMNLLRKMITILSTDEEDHTKEDPYGEENWGVDNEFDILGELRAGARMTNKQFIDSLKRQLVGKTIIMIPYAITAGAYIPYKEKFRVVDIVLQDENDKHQGVILIDDKGKWHNPDREKKIKILD